MTLKKLIWPAVGALAIVLSVWLLYRELRGLSLADLGDSFAAIPTSGSQAQAGSRLARCSHVPGPQPNPYNATAAQQNSNTGAR